MTTTQSIAEELHRVLSDAVASHGIPGAAAGLVVDGTRHSACVGVTNARHPLPVMSQTLSQVGSISKTFTSAAVMLLVEAGEIDLDDPVSRHLPALGPATGIDFDTITVEHTLSHQSGFDGDHLLVSREPSDLTVLASARHLFEPATGFSYSNAGFSVAGAVVEAVSGRPFGHFVRERLLVPLGLQHATYWADHVVTRSVMAPHWCHEGTAHVITGAGWQPGWELGPVDHAGGGLIASVDDLLTWCDFQRHGRAIDGTRLLSPESLRRLHTPVLTSTVVEDIALDWHVERPNGVEAIGHGGVTVGYVSDLVFVPQRDLAFVGLTNATHGAALNQTVRRWAFERFGGLHEVDPVPDPAVGATVDRDRLTGTYLHPFGRISVAPGHDPGTVTITHDHRDDVADGWQPPPEAATLAAFVTSDQAVTLDAPGIQRIIRFDDAPGEAGWVQWGGRRAPRCR